MTEWLKWIWATPPPMVEEDSKKKPVEARFQLAYSSLANHQRIYYKNGEFLDTTKVWDSFLGIFCGPPTMPNRAPLILKMLQANCKKGDQYMMFTSDHCIP